MDYCAWVIHMSQEFFTQNWLIFLESTTKSTTFYSKKQEVDLYMNLVTVVKILGHRPFSLSEPEKFGQSGSVLG